MSDDAILPVLAYSHDELMAWEDLDKAAEAQLEKRMGEWRVPILPYEPADDTLLVFRLPAEEKKTDAGIILPDHQIEVEEQFDRRGELHRIETKHTIVLNVGLIISAGNAARDWMRSHGFVLGDLVKFSRYSGEEENARWFGPSLPESAKDMLQLDVREIKGSFDLWARLHGPSPSLKRVFAVDRDGNGIHVFKPILKERSAHG